MNTIGTVRRLVAVGVGIFGLAVIAAVILLRALAEAAEIAEHVDEPDLGDA